jgi:23S rRNA pseudouridine1911/1915/1917 synthase
MKKRVFTAAVGDPPRLAALVAARLLLTADAATDVIARGAVHVDGERQTDPASPVTAGARIAVHPVHAPTSPPRVVLHDDWCLVLDKPPGMPSQATPAESSTALDAFAHDLAPEARLLHRLDRDASGLVLFAARTSACAPLQAALDAGRVDRRYLAVVAGHVGPVGHTGRIALRIARHTSDARLRAALPENAPGGKPALTHYRVVGHGDGITGLALTLDTGRTHQLRVHLSAIGHAIVGDRLYGGVSFSRLCLHAHHLAFPHPRDGILTSVTSPVPDSLASLVRALTNPSP